MTDYEKLKALYDDIERLSDESLSNQELSKTFIAWMMESMRFLKNKYGENSREYKNYMIVLDIIEGEQNESISKEAFRDRVINTLQIIKLTWNPLLLELKEDNVMNNHVFIVHGHDGEIKYRISNLIRKVGLNPIILHEQVNTCSTIIEKIEKHGCQASAAILLFTPDDEGKEKNGEKLRARARQNVVFEAGYFMGLLGRDKTVLVVSDSTIELPGDLNGVVYEGKNSEFEIAKSLKTMGLPVDLNNL